MKASRIRIDKRKFQKCFNLECQKLGVKAISNIEAHIRKYTHIFQEVYGGQNEDKNCRNITSPSLERLQQ